MKMAKRMMATLLCLAMLLSGFALAETETATVQGQVQIQDEADLESGDHSETTTATADEDDKVDEADKKDEADAVTATDDSTGDTAEDSVVEADPDADPDQNDPEQVEDDDADELEDEVGDATDEDADEPEAEDGDADEPEDEDGATSETDETEDADADIDLLSLEQEVDPIAADDAECAHDGELLVEDWKEPTNKPYENQGEVGHKVYFILHSKTTCLECGEVLENTEEEIAEVLGHNLTAEDGIFKCDDCEYFAACTHGDGEYEETETIEKLADDLDGYVVSKGPEGHTIKVRTWTQTHCQKCDYRWNQSPVTVIEKTEAHVWDEENGAKVCKKCGYENSCTHENVEYVDEWNDVFDAIKVNGDEHSAIYYLYANVKCKDCGVILDRDVVIDSWTQTEDHRFEEDIDGEISCTVCGYVIPCSHPDVEFLIQEDVGWKEPQQVDEDYHMVRRYDQIHFRCRDCGKEWGWDYPDYEEREPVKERHIWNDEGICKICGYRSECTEHDFQPVPGSEKDGTYDYRYLDANTHEITLGVFRELACTKCGYTIDEFVEGSAYEPIVEEHYWSQDGYCMVCGAKGFCQHPAKYVETVTGTVSRDDMDPIDTNDETHTVYADSYIQYHCTRCDTWWGYEVTQYGIPTTEPHTWDTINGGRCIICGHSNPCDHVGTTEDFEETSSRVIPELITATTHTLDTYVTTGTRCTKCGAEFNLVDHDELDKMVTEAHKFVRKDGKTVCEVCGYTKPETSESPEKTEESTFEQVANGTVVHGVTVGQPTRMGVTMVQAMAGIAAEYGADAKIEIQNIDKVLTADECTALNALQPTERILVALSAIGYGDEVKNAISELQLTLSENARVLILQVNARVALMNDAEKAAFQKAIEKYFPNASGASITLEIRRAGETATRRERYGFTQVNGEWAFAKLEVAKA